MKIKKFDIPENNNWGTTVNETLKSINELIDDLKDSSDAKNVMMNHYQGIDEKDILASYTLRAEPIWFTMNDRISLLRADYIFPDMPEEVDTWLKEVKEAVDKDKEEYKEYSPLQNMDKNLAMLEEQAKSKDNKDKKRTHVFFD